MRERIVSSQINALDSTLQWLRGEELTCRDGPVEEDGVGYEDEHHRCVCGDVVRNGMLEALLTTAQKWDKKLQIINA